MQKVIVLLGLISGADKTEQQNECDPTQAQYGHACTQAPSPGQSQMQHKPHVAGFYVGSVFDAGAGAYAGTEAYAG